jgi:putative flippase GtrA
VYENGNACSHFQPIRDSLKIYFVLFRFALLSLMTAVIDNIIFLLAFASFGQIALAQAAGRLVAVLFNYGAARRAVFLSRAPHRDTLWRYLLLVTVNGIAAYAGITYLHTRFGWKVLTSKICVEAGLFVVNFALQRDFVFTRRGSRERDTNPALRPGEQEAATALD